MQYQNLGVNPSKDTIAEARKKLEVVIAEEKSERAGNEGKGSLSDHELLMAQNLQQALAWACEKGPFDEADLVSDIPVRDGTRRRTRPSGSQEAFTGN